MIPRVLLLGEDEILYHFITFNLLKIIFNFIAIFYIYIVRRESTVK